MKNLLSVLCLLFFPILGHINAQQNPPNEINRLLAFTYDSEQDYSRFSGRVTDKDDAERTLKIQARTKNIRFLKIGDLLTFSINNIKLTKQRPCRAYVKKNIEEYYIVIRVEEIGVCWHRNHYFRRGMIMQFNVPALQRRILEALAFKTYLLGQRKDFLIQLNDVNHFLWNYEHQKLLKTSEFDQKIVEIEAEKQKVLNSLISTKNDYMRLQKELVRNLKIIDKNIEFHTADAGGDEHDGWKTELRLGTPIKGPSN